MISWTWWPLFFATAQTLLATPPILYPRRIAIAVTIAILIHRVTLRTLYRFWPYASVRSIRYLTASALLYVAVIVVIDEVTDIRLLPQTALIISVTVVIAMQALRRKRWWRLSQRRLATGSRRH